MQDRKVTIIRIESGLSKEEADIVIDTVRQQLHDLHLSRGENIVDKIKIEDQEVPNLTPDEIKTIIARRERQLEVSREYNIRNYEKVRARAKTWAAEHPDKVSEYMSKPKYCEICNISTRASNFTTHKKSKKHLMALEAFERGKGTSSELLM